MKTRKIIILSFDPATADARLQRQVRFLSAHFSVEVIALEQLLSDLRPPVNGKSPSSIGQLHHWLLRGWRGRALLLAGRCATRKAYEIWYWNSSTNRSAIGTLANRAVQLIAEHGADAIHAHNWVTLPAAVRAAHATGAKVVSDLREYAPLEHENRWTWHALRKPLIEYFLGQCLPSVAATITVSQGFADRYAEEFGVRPLVAMNAPVLEPGVTFRPTNPNLIKLVHHGIAARDRQLERMIRAVAAAEPRFTLTFLLLDFHRGYLAELKRLANQLAPQRIMFLEPVPPAQIINCISQYDLGLFILPPITFNFRETVPNKFLDYIGAGLAVCVSPETEMAHLTQVAQYGVVTPSCDSDTVAGTLNALSAPQLDQMKQNALRARNTLNAQVEMNKLVDLYHTLLSSH